MTGIFTILLVIITGFYAWWTRGMARTMAKQVGLESRPYVGFDRDITFIIPGNSTDPEVEIDSVAIRYSVVNLGKVPIVYKVKNLTFNGNDGIVNGVELVLYPGQSIFYTTNTFQVPKTKITNFKGTSSIEITYWALGIPENKYFSSRKYDLHSTNSYYILEDKAGELE